MPRDTITVAFNIFVLLLAAMAIGAAPFAVFPIPTDPDRDGLMSRFEKGDADGDKTANYLEIDDDDDGILTTYEMPDPNGDGNPSDATDTDGDGVADFLDQDDDNDGIPTREEFADPNGDGDPIDAVDRNDNDIPDYLDPDGDGRVPELESTSVLDEIYQVKDENEQMLIELIGQFDEETADTKLDSSIDESLKRLLQRSPARVSPSD